MTEPMGVYVHMTLGLFIDVGMLPIPREGGMRKIVWTLSGYRDIRWPDFFNPMFVKKASKEDTESMILAFNLYQEEIAS